MSNQREFTESWLQALTLSANHEKARAIRPWLTTIQVLCASETLPEQKDEALKLWNYAHQNDLEGLLELIPANSTPWHFEDDEEFVFTPVPDPGSNSLEIQQNHWLVQLGIADSSIRAKATVTSQDWTTLVRKQAIRRSKPMNVNAFPSGDVLDLDCLLDWSSRTWTVRFVQPDWMSLQYDSEFLAPRPSFEQLTLRMIDALAAANDRFKSKAVLGNFNPESTAWTTCIGDFAQWHRDALLADAYGLSPWVKRTWNCVWPVIYRERNRLRGPCDLNYLRSELKSCFDHSPELCEWMFITSRLACEIHLGSGIGLSGNFEA
jgi:hypothetical protein